MSKKQSLVLIIIVLLILTNVITYTFTLDKSKDIFTNLLNNCLSSKLQNKEIVSFSVKPEKSGFTVYLDNNTECLIIKEIAAHIEFSYLGKTDTLRISITEPINPFEKGTIYVDEVDVDSLKIINYSLIKLDIF